MRGLEERTIVVAGAATGIGASTAARLLDEGANVVVGDLDGDRAAQLVEQLDPTGGRAIAVAFDISDELQVDTLFERAVQRFGGVDGVHVNAVDSSAQTFGSDTDAVDVDLAVWHRSLAVDLTGYLLVVRRAVPELLKRETGSIVMSSSNAAFLGPPVFVSYAVAKAGINALMRHVARRWGKEGIRCNAVAPAATLTDTVRAQIDEEFEAATIREMALSRLGEPEDIAAAVAFLLSDDASWITGQVFHVNGGHIFG